MKYVVYIPACDYADQIHNHVYIRTSKGKQRIDFYEGQAVIDSDDTEIVKAFECKGWPIYTQESVIAADEERRRYLAQKGTITF